MWKQIFLSLIAFLFVGMTWMHALSLAGAKYQQPERDYSKETARQSPDWVKAAVIYELNTRNFSPEGTFNAVTARLDDLKKLGITILWLMPIHPFGQEKKKGTIGSPYAVRDYYAINPDYGSKEDFKRLVSEAHRRKIKVIIDIVANHTAWDSVMMKTPDFYTHDASGKIIPPVPDWADVADLNYDNPKLRAYMIDMLKFWIREYDLDGFRCDVAGFVPTDFWEQTRAELDKIKPDIVMLAEWHSPDLMVKAFNLDYAWPLHSTLTEVLQGSKPASAIQETLAEERAKFPRGTLHMRFSDNHDEKRAIVRFGEKGALAASALVFTLDGVPLIYNGMEVGDTTESGAPALFEKMPIFWQIAERRPEFPRFYKYIIGMRKYHSILQQGETVWLHNSDQSRVVTYLRRDGKEEILVAINLTNRPFTGTVEASGTFTEISPDLTEDGKGEGRPVALPAISLDAYGFRFFHRAMK